MDTLQATGGEEGSVGNTEGSQDFGSLEAGAALASYITKCWDLAPSNMMSIKEVVLQLLKFNWPCLGEIHVIQLCQKSTEFRMNIFLIDQGVSPARNQENVVEIELNLSSQFISNMQNTREQALGNF